MTEMKDSYEAKYRIWMGLHPTPNQGAYDQWVDHCVAQISTEDLLMALQERGVTGLPLIGGFFHGNMVNKEDVKATKRKLEPELSSRRVTRSQTKRMKV